MTLAARAAASSGTREYQARYGAVHVLLFGEDNGCDA
jgi:hypothetical protein